MHTQPTPQDLPVYSILNTRMRAEDRGGLKPFLSLIKLLLSGLYQLPPVTALLFRGVRLDLHASFPDGAERVW